MVGGDMCERIIIRERDVYVYIYMCKDVCFKRGEWWNRMDVQDHVINVTDTRTNEMDVKIVPCDSHMIQLALEVIDEVWEMIWWSSSCGWYEF